MDLSEPTVNLARPRRAVGPGRDPTCPIYSGLRRSSPTVPYFALLDRRSLDTSVLRILSVHGPLFSIGSAIQRAQATDRTPVDAIFGPRSCRARGASRTMWSDAANRFLFLLFIYLLYGYDPLIYKER